MSLKWSARLSASLPPRCVLLIAAAYAWTPGLALPAVAQSLTDQEARHVAETVVDSRNKAFAARDPAELAAQYPEDYVIVGPPGWPPAPGGTMSGRATIEKLWTGNFKAYSPNPDTLIDVRKVGNDAVWVAVVWGGLYNGANGPEQEKGTASRVYVRNGDTWKIWMETWSVAMAP